MAREEGKLKSARRKPLRDVSNGGLRLSRSAKAKKNKDKKEEPLVQTLDDRFNGENSLDRLLLAHSDLSSLLRQIDELVVQAVKVKPNDKKMNDEIRTFANVLSEVHSSLKPSVLKLEEELAACHIEPEIQSGESPVEVPTVANEGDEHGADTPEPTRQDSLVSPSPLVSWRATDCLVERGKQLFLLTPLPRPRTTVSKGHASSRLTVLKEITLCTNLQDPLLSAQASESNHDVAEPVTKIAESTSGVGFASPLKNPMGDCSTVLATPCLNIPPSSCALLEPDHIEKSDTPHMSTPYPVGNNKFWDSENSIGYVSDRLGLKYPGLAGIRQSFMLRNVSKAIEASPAWMMSPPKCCTLLEPIDEKPVKDGKTVAGDFNQQVCLAAPEKSSIHTTQDHGKKILCGQDNLARSLAMVENTPLWKGSESTMHRGKRAGENTLKKELWTKFEAATMDGFCLNFCVLEGTSQKGFLDRLEEASCDEGSPHADSCR